MAYSHSFRTRRHANLWHKAYRLCLIFNWLKDMRVRRKWTWLMCVCVCWNLCITCVFCSVILFWAFFVWEQNVSRPTEQVSPPLSPQFCVIPKGANDAAILIADKYAKVMPRGHCWENSFIVWTWGLKMIDRKSLCLNLLILMSATKTRGKNILFLLLGKGSEQWD